METYQLFESAISKLPENWTNAVRVSTEKDIVTCVQIQSVPFQVPGPFKRTEL